MRATTWPARTRSPSRTPTSRIAPPICAPTVAAVSARTSAVVEMTSEAEPVETTATCTGNGVRSGGGRLRSSRRFAETAAAAPAMTTTATIAVTMRLLMGQSPPGDVILIIARVADGVERLPVGGLAAELVRARGEVVLDAPHSLIEFQLLHTGHLGAE